MVAAVPSISFCFTSGISIIQRKYHGVTMRPIFSVARNAPWRGRPTVAVISSTIVCNPECSGVSGLK